MYVSRLESTITQWTENIVKSDEEMLPKRTDDGKWYSQAGVELFRIIHDQIELVRDKTRGQLLFDVAKVSVKAIGLFVSAQMRNSVANPPADVGQDARFVFRLCAISNSSVSRIKDIEKLQNWVAEALEPPYCFRVGIEMNMDQYSENFEVTFTSSRRYISYNDMYAVVTSSGQAVQQLGPSSEALSAEISIL